MIISHKYITLIEAPMNELPFTKFETLVDDLEVSISEWEIIESSDRPLYLYHTEQAMEMTQILTLRCQKWDTVWFGRFVYEEGIGGRSLLDDKSIDFICEYKRYFTEKEIEFVKLDDGAIVARTRGIINIGIINTHKEYLTYRWENCRRHIRVIL